MQKRLLTLAALGMVLFMACGSPTAPSSDQRTFAFDFSSGPQGWTPIFAAYRIFQEGSPFFVSDYRRLPSPLDQAKEALFISGPISYMGYTRRVAGLRPDASYRILFTVEFATNFATGGRLGGVSMSAGALRQEPGRRLDEELGRWRATFEIAGQNRPVTKDLVWLGDLPSGGYQIRAFNNAALPFEGKTDGDGSFWFLMGISNGFVGLVDMYFTKFSATVERVP